MIHKAVRDDWTRVLPKQGPESDRQAHTVLTAFDRLCPWERVRSLRVFDLVCASELQSLHVLESSLTKPGLDMQQLARLAEADPATSDASYAGTIQHYQSFSYHWLGAGDFFFSNMAEAAHHERVPWNWLKTTFPLNLTLDESDQKRIWQVRLAREVSLRSLLLRLKLMAFKKAHGEYPDRIDNQGFGMNAIDPYTGTEYGYRREGFPFELWATVAATSIGEMVPVGQPVFWSAGPGNVRHIAPKVDTITQNGPGGAAPIQVQVARNDADTTALVFPLP
jgi:hypothetical protein